MIPRLLSPLAGIALALAATLLLHAQTKAVPIMPSPRVVVVVPASIHKVGEPLEVTVTLENVGTKSFYLPKELSGGGGIPGFEIRLSRSGEPYCFVNADYGCGRTGKGKKVNQFLDEDFLLLPPGGLVGMHARLATACKVVPQSPPLRPGRYEVTAVYSGSSVCVPDLSNKKTKFPVLQSTVTAAPVQVELTE